MPIKASHKIHDPLSINGTYYEALQGVLATGDIAKKCGDNLFLIHRQPTKIDRKRVAICDSDNPFLLSTKQHVFALLFSTAMLLPGDLTCVQAFF